MVLDDHFGLGKPTTNIGLGCGRLVARDGLRESAALVETALELGIRHFDVAPSYGMGTAEEVLGAVLGSVRDVTICTKVGIPRPTYSRHGYIGRKVANRILPRRGSLRSLAKRSATRSGRRDDLPGFVFSEDAIRASLADSLERLRRESVDVLLLHEPTRADLNADVAARMNTLVREGVVGAYGVGIDASSDLWARFGSTWQSRWPGAAAEGYDRDVSYVFHGALRYAGTELADGTIRPAAVLRQATERFPGCVVVVSASSPARLRQVLEDV